VHLGLGLRADEDVGLAWNDGQKAWMGRVCWRLIIPALVLQGFPPFPLSRKIHSVTAMDWEEWRFRGFGGGKADPFVQYNIITGSCKGTLYCSNIIDEGCIDHRESSKHIYK
jgi:hypothetical protein